jgi:hypothetical protein
MDLCQLPKDWTMNEKISGVTVGRYLSCLYAQKQQVNYTKVFNVEDFCFDLA